ncbi:hypothetical protein [Halalkalibacterium ligniniphilum]|uniref:hypothetical protein n=1 Tax=Halalkalibacterium ligniniphilum TaxID=1134413 RepID=UPI00034BDDDB|nr:hypothetical protein [Halalkalibacterium ligniniphilum]
MDSTIQSHFNNLQSKDRNVQYEAYKRILAATEEKVDWAYDVWDQLTADLTDADNHRRSRAAQFLCRLAKSDPEKRMIKDFPAIWKVTYDEKFVTARHSLQSIWKIGLAGSEQKEMIIKSLVERFKNCVHEKNYTLIRFDIIQGLRNLYDEIKDEEIKKIAFELIKKEDDEKYKKKYSSVWKET